MTGPHTRSSSMLMRSRRRSQSRSGRATLLGGHERARVARRARSRTAGSMCSGLDRRELRQDGRRRAGIRRVRCGSFRSWTHSSRKARPKSNDDLPRFTRAQRRPELLYSLRPEDAGRRRVQEFDLLVIGGGSGGLATAQRAVEYGARVALFEPAAARRHLRQRRLRAEEGHVERGRDRRGVAARAALRVRRAASAATTGRS